MRARLKYFCAVNADGHFYPYTVSYSKEHSKRKFDYHCPPGSMLKADRQKVRIVEIQIKEAA